MVVKNLDIYGIYKNIFCHYNILLHFKFSPLFKYLNLTFNRLCLQDMLIKVI